MLAPAASHVSEGMLFVIGVALMGGPAAIVAHFRGRSRVGWFFLGLLASVLVVALFPKSLPAARFVAMPAISVAPIALFLLPRGGQRKPKRRVEREDWSSSALEVRTTSRDPAARPGEADGRRDPRP